MKSKFVSAIQEIAPSLGAQDAIVSFLNTAISLQLAGSSVIATDEPEDEFIDFYGFSKEQLNEGITALRRELSKY